MGLCMAPGSPSGQRRSDGVQKSPLPVRFKEYFDSPASHSLCKTYEMQIWLQLVSINNPNYLKRSWDFMTSAMLKN